jgi:hypothetical protein
MDKDTCLSQLKVQYYKDTNQKDNVSKLASDAW